MLPDHLSASRMQTWLGCPLKYKLIYLDKVPWDFYPSSFALGSAVHAAIEAFYRSFSDGERLETIALLELFEGFWQGQIKDRVLETDADPSALLLSGKGLLELFCGSVQPCQVLAVEEQFRLPMADAKGEYLTDLVGVMDLVEADNDGKTVVVDHKTAAKRPGDDDLERHLQLTCYGFASRRLFSPSDEPVLLRIDYLIKNKQPLFEQRYTVRTMESDRKLILLVTDLLHAIDAGVFPASQGWGCSDCQVKSHCYCY